jgi:DNA-binding transcriptional regulator YiaG
MIITLQLSAAGSSARFVHTPGQPPSLVIHDGTTTLVLRPADSADGLADAAGLAEDLVQGASEWESGCRRTLAAATQLDDPDDLAHAWTAEDEHPNATLMGWRRQSSCATKTQDQAGGVTVELAPKPTRRTELVAARKAAGFTQEALAARLGVERSTVYRWESGETNPLPMLRPGLANLLRVTDERLSALLGEPVDHAPLTAFERGRPTATFS